MLTLRFATHTYQLPDRWEELSSDQFIHLVGFLTAHSTGALTADMVKTLYFLDVAGIHKRKVHNTNQANTFSENVYRISRNLNFMFRVVYENNQAIRTMPSEFTNLLERWLPEDLEGDEPELRVARKLKKHVEIDCTFARNLVPYLKIKKMQYPGYRMDLTGEILNTDLPAGDFIDASTLHDQYMKTGSDQILDQMVTRLYKLPDGTAAGIPLNTKIAILFNFRAILLFLTHRTQYGILWNSGTNQDGKISIGFVDSLYSLAKAGYGDTTRLKTVSVVEFLDLLLKEVIDTVKSLHDMKMDLVKIAEATKLSINQINSIL
jgi:hypothetical protein